MFDAQQYRKQVEEAAQFIQSKTSLRPQVGIILGTGLAQLAEHIQAETIIPYEEIPHFPLSTVETHTGRLIIGRLEEVPVYALQGRFHLYEGYTPQQVTFPVRVMAVLGVNTLLISNAAGGMNPHFRKGDLMLITDHINLQGQNPLIGPNIDEWGPRFPDMSEPYSRRLLQLAEQVALEKKIRVEKGVYVALSGPNLETPAEYRFLRIIGADAVGMSMVPEVLVARHMGMDVLGFGIVTDECYPEALQPLSLEEVIKVAGETEPKMAAIITGVVAAL